MNIFDWFGSWEIGHFGERNVEARRNTLTGRVQMFCEHPDRWIDAHKDHWGKFIPNEKGTDKKTVMDSDFAREQAIPAKQVEDQ